jgi:nucleoside-diphosphate-sugar epimerase
MKKAFVTGAAGFLASHLIKLLVEKKYDVTGFVKKGDSINRISHLPIKIVTGDLKNPSTLNKKIPKDSIVFHCYSLSPGAHASKKKYLLENVISTKNLLDECKKSNINKLVYISSCSIIGPYVTRNIVEETKPAPDNDYGITKLQAEKLIAKFFIETHTPTIVTRLSTIYGPNMHINSSSMRLFRLTKKSFFPLIGGGKNLFEFSFIKNAVNGIYQAAENCKGGFQLFNIADIKKRSLKDIIKTISRYTNPNIKLISTPYFFARILGLTGDLIVKITGKPFPFRTRTLRGVLGGWISNPKKAIDTFGYKQKYSLEEGVKETIKWLKKEKIMN